jgi:hypothetical protein
MDDELVIGSLPVHEALKTEQQIEDERVADLRAKRRAQDHLITTIKDRLSSSLGALGFRYRERLGEINRADQGIKEANHEKLREQVSAYEIIRKRLEKRVAAHREAVTRYFGSLKVSQSLAYNTEALWWQKSWSDVPSVIRISFHRLRAVKNKLPPGKYFVMATLFDRVGGHPLQGLTYTHGEGSQKRTLRHFDSTNPVAHSGAYFQVGSKI